MRGLDKEQWEQMQWFEQASNFGPTDLVMEERYLGTIDGCLSQFRERAGGFTEGRERLIATACNSGRYLVLIWRCAYGSFLCDTCTRSLDKPLILLELQFDNSWDSSAYQRTASSCHSSSP